AGEAGATACIQSGNAVTGPNAPPNPAIAIATILEITSAWFCVRQRANSAIPKQTMTAANSNATNTTARTGPFGRYPNSSAPPSSTTRSCANWAPKAVSDLPTTSSGKETGAILRRCHVPQSFSRKKPVSTCCAFSRAKRIANPGTAYSAPVAPRWPPATSWALAPGIRNGTNSSGMTIITSTGAAARRRILAPRAARATPRRRMPPLGSGGSLPVLQDAQIGLLERGTLHVDLDDIGGQVPELLKTCCQGAARWQVRAGGHEPFAGAFPGRRYWHRPVVTDPGIQPDPYPRATPGIARVLHWAMVLDPAAGQHGEAGAEVLELVHVVGGVDHGGAGIGQAAHVAHDLVAGLDVRPDGGLVQEHHGRLVRQ